MNGICLLVAGVVRATIPGPEFTLAWEHSVQKTRWEERYVVDADALVLVEARVAGSGAGMEPAPSATLRGGLWTWHPATRLPELRLVRSGYAGDYTICREATCSTLSALLGPTEDGATVTVRPCA